MSYVTALGALALGASQIPGSCWDRDGFKACHQNAWELARKKCDPAYGGSDTVAFERGGVGPCIDSYADQFAARGCKLQCPEVAALDKSITPQKAARWAFYGVLGVAVFVALPQLVRAVRSARASAATTGAA